MGREHGRARVRSCDVTSAAAARYREAPSKPRFGLSVVDARRSRSQKKQVPNDRDANPIRAVFASFCAHPLLPGTDSHIT